MSLTVTVTPNETFPDNSNVTRAMLRNAASPSVSVSGSISPADMSAVTEGQILVGSTDAHSSGSNKQLKAVTPSSNASVTAGGNITPSDGTITKAKLSTDNTNNIIEGQAALSSVNSADSVLVYDADGSTGARLKKATVANVLNAGVTSTSSSVTYHTTFANADATATVDFNANPIQEIAITTSSGAHTLSFAVSNMPTVSDGDAKSVQLRLKNTASVAVTLSFATEFLFLKSVPNTIAAGKDAIIAMTAFDDKVISGYAATT